MRLPALLAVLFVLVGCQSTRVIDRHTLDKLYFDTVMRPDVLSSVPKQIDSHAPPTVVNWWYAGSQAGDHHIVFRKLTWDQQGKPIGEEKRYRVSQDALKISEPFAYTKDAARWLHLYEAAVGEIEPPADLPAVRKTSDPISIDPIHLPDQPVLPPTD